MPLIPSLYSAPFWLVGGHLQTIIPIRFRKVQGVSFQRERLFTPEHDCIDLDWSCQNSKKLVILSYGIAASLKSSYVLGMVKKLSQAGYDVLIWHYRNRFEPNKVKSITHGASSDELQKVIDHALTKNYTSIALIGCSMGGNIVLKYLGEMGSCLPSSISKAIIISTPCDLKGCVQTLHTGSAYFIYQRHFFLKIKAQLEKKKKMYPELLECIDLDKVRSCADIDRLVVVPLHDFANVEEYYQLCNGKRYIPSITIPTLILSAQNDPFLNKDCFPIKECEQHPCVALEMPRHGGHIGFMINTLHGPYYSEERTVHFLDSSF